MTMRVGKIPKCGCGKTRDKEGLCDGSHAQLDFEFELDKSTGEVIKKSNSGNQIILGWKESDFD